MEMKQSKPTIVLTEVEARAIQSLWKCVLYELDGEEEDFIAVCRSIMSEGDEARICNITVNPKSEKEYTITIDEVGGKKTYKFTGAERALAFASYIINNSNRDYAPTVQHIECL